MHARLFNLKLASASHGDGLHGAALGFGMFACRAQLRRLRLQDVDIAIRALAVVNAGFEAVYLRSGVDGSGDVGANVGAVGQWMDMK